MERRVRPRNFAPPFGSGTGADDPAPLILSSESAATQIRRCAYAGSLVGCDAAVASADSEGGHQRAIARSSAGGGSPGGQIGTDCALVTSADVMNLLPRCRGQRGPCALAADEGCTRFDRGAWLPRVTGPIPGWR